MEASIRRRIVVGVLAPGRRAAQLNAERLAQGIAAVEDQPIVGAPGEADLGLEKAGVVGIGGQAVARELNRARDRVGDGRAGRR